MADNEAGRTLWFFQGFRVLGEAFMKLTTMLADNEAGRTLWFCQGFC
jgi:hypothetical protein